MNRILIATDFSSAADNALRTAAIIAKAANCGITLLHVRNSKSADFLENHGQSIEQLEDYLSSLAAKTASEHQVDCLSKIRQGSIFTEINEEAAKGEYGLLLIGTHGSKGFRQMLFGADLLKIARKCPVPLLATPGNATLIKNGIKRIVFPFGGHQKFENKVKAVAFLAQLFHSEILIYSIDRYAAKINKETYENIDLAEAYFQSLSIKTRRVEDEMTEFSVGYSKQTMNFAQKEDATLIAVMSTASDDFSFLSTVDKENLINNELGLSILLTSDY